MAIFNSYGKLPEGITQKEIITQDGIQTLIITWLVVSNIFLFSIIYGIILPIDVHMFQDG